MEQYFDSGMYELHPQYDLLKKHVERSVQDIFIDGLKNKMNNLVFAFDTENHIDLFSNRMLKYWEELEDYEKCNEIVLLISKLKEIWRNRDSLDTLDKNFIISDLFKNTNDNERLL